MIVWFVVLVGFMLMGVNSHVGGGMKIFEYIFNLRHNLALIHSWSQTSVATVWCGAVLVWLHWLGNHIGQVATPSHSGQVWLWLNLVQL